MIDYYENLFSGQRSSASQDYNSCNVIPSSIMDEDNRMLTAIPNGGEIKEVVFQMNPNRAPGPEGFSGAFYHACWDIIAKDVTAGVQQFFRDGYLVPNLNSSFLVLIPKTDDAVTISHYHPIALANFFKIITKLLGNRLGSIMERIISPHQTAFIHGRHIHDSISLVSLRALI